MSAEPYPTSDDGDREQKGNEIENPDEIIAEFHHDIGIRENRGEPRNGK